MAHIYVIDDDEQLLRMVGLMLERGGHSVTLINNPEDGLKRIIDDKPDLLVLDVMMPNMSGHDVTREIRNDKAVKDLPIMVLTARSQDIDRMTALKSGADAYLSKPVTSQELIEQVDALLAQSGGGKPAPDAGMIITIFGFRGGTGRTTLAVNLAAALRRVSQQEVCLVDLATGTGQAVMHMRLQARSSWGDLPAPLDWQALQNRLIIHPSGLRVLAAPAKPFPPDSPSREQTTNILNILKNQMAFTVVDAPSVYNTAFITALSTADMALHVLTPEVIAVQTAVQLNRLLAKDNITARRKSHILNQINPDAQLTQTAVERGLNTRVAFQISFDTNQSRAVTQGVPLTLTNAKGALPTVIKRMAEAIWQRVAAQESN